MLKKIPHCTNKVAYSKRTYPMKSLRSKNKGMAVSRIYPWGGLLGGTYNIINNTKERLKKSLGQNLYFSHFVVLCTPDGDSLETTLIRGVFMLQMCILIFQEPFRWSVKNWYFYIKCFDEKHANIRVKHTNS